MCSLGLRVFVHLSDEVDLRDEAPRSCLKPFGPLIACISLIGVVEVNKPLVDLRESLELEPVPELSSEDAICSFDGGLVPGLAWCSKHWNDLLREQEQNNAVEHSRPRTRTGKGKAIIELHDLWLLETLEEPLAVLDGFITRLRVDPLEVLEFTGESERESNEVHGLSSASNKLLPDEVDLKQALSHTVDGRLGIMQVSANAFATHLWFGREAMLGKSATDEPQGNGLRLWIHLVVSLQDRRSTRKMLERVCVQPLVNPEDAFLVALAVGTALAFLPTTSVQGKILIH